MNETIELLNKRCSTRVFSEDPVTEAEREAILHAAFRAPTAGNMMLYSIIEVSRPDLKHALAVSCDDQPFIEKAPLVLVFLADYQRWMDLWEHAGVERVEVEQHRRESGVGDLMLCACDALIAAQNAVVAAESLGIGSCYIGDVLENGESIAELLAIPRYAMPVTAVVFGRSRTAISPRPRVTRGVVHVDGYSRLDEAELAALSGEIDAAFSPHGLRQGFENHAQAAYARKHASDFMREMNRSVAWWIGRWERGC